MNTETFYGYDGNGYNIGDRVELHPSSDFWMRGAKFATVVGSSLTPRDRIRVTLDNGGRIYYGSEVSFRRA